MAEDLAASRENEPLRPLGEARPSRVGPGSRGGVTRGTRRLPPVVVVRRAANALPASNRGQGHLIAAWAVYSGLVFMRELKTRPGVWPCPQSWLKGTSVFVMLGLLAMWPPAERMAGWLGWGFVLAFLLGPGSKEIQTSGTLMGWPVTAQARARQKPAGSISDGSSNVTIGPVPGGPMLTP